MEPSLPRHICGSTPMIRSLLRRVTPLRRAYRFVSAALRTPREFRRAWDYAFERPHLDAAHRRAAVRIAALAKVSPRGAEDEAAWRNAAAPWAQRNADERASAARRNAFVELLASFSPGHVLEVGCNYGANLQRLRSRSPEALIVGVDVGIEALQRAGAEIRRSLACASAYALPFPDGAFDVAFTMCLLMHLPERDASRGLAELVRVARRYVVLVEYADAAVSRGAEHMGLDFRIYNHDYHAMLRLVGGADLLSMRPTQAADPAGRLMTIVLRCAGSDAAR